MNHQHRITNNRHPTTNNDVVVSVKNVSKKFCKHLRRSMAYGIGDLSKNLFGIKPDSTQLRKSEFWAVNDISFELRRSEVLGLIGANGSGKSTILRLLAGILPPDAGEISVRGRVGALIAIGAGFHPHMTARENIYLNGTILGMTREEIDSKFEDIVDFAEIGDFLEAPVSTYSSGMRVRLGFSIAAYMEPDVAFIDEVLAVGDFAFRQKCSARINEIRNKAAVILVSHNMRDILMLCTRTIVMDKGKVVCQGAPEEAVNYYIDMMNVEEAEKLEQKKAAKEDAGGMLSKSSVYGEVFHNTEKITDVGYRWVDKEGNTVGLVDHGDAITLSFSFRLLKPVDNLIIGVPIWDSNNDMITGISTDMHNLRIRAQKDGRVKGRLCINSLIFNSGDYVSYMAIMDSKEVLYRKYIGKFTVRNMSVFFGIVTPEHNWEFDPVCS